MREAARHWMASFVRRCLGASEQFPAFRVDAEIERLKREHARTATNDSDAEWERMEARFRELDRLRSAYHSGDLDKRGLLFDCCVSMVDVHQVDLPRPESGRRASHCKGEASCRVSVERRGGVPDRAASCALQREVVRPRQGVQKSRIAIRPRRSVSVSARPPVPIQSRPPGKSGARRGRLERTHDLALVEGSRQRRARCIIAAGRTLHRARRPTT